MSSDGIPAVGDGRVYSPQTGDSTFIQTSGGLLTEQLVGKLRHQQVDEQAVQPAAFALPDGDVPTETELESEIAAAWDRLRERWDDVTLDNELFGMGVSDARSKWLIPLFEELGFAPAYLQANVEMGGLSANLSHRGWPDQGVESYTALGEYDAPILHTVAPAQGLDESDAHQKSPHDTLQDFLNASQGDDWAVLSNGLSLRLLRDYYHTYTRGYVEFDLENIFTNRNYGDFRALYRLCHASRFIEPVVAESDTEEPEAPVEQLYQIALATGVKVGQDLQANVVSALETLGNGFLNDEIRAAMTSEGQADAEAYYQDLLYVVYRLLFLMFTEQRGMMADRDELYTTEYSVTQLRSRSEDYDESDRNTDLWEGLQRSFSLVGAGNEGLGVPGYNGALFDDDQLTFVDDATCPNAALLSAVFDLTHIEQDGYRQRISYADLGVDEIGAVYESLLEFTPQVADSALEFDDRTVAPGRFYLDDRGMERKETGSYYTDPGLVDELIDSALKPVVQDRVDDSADADTQEQQLLEIDVCDPACGSGAFLIAANNYLGQELAQIRSGSLYPAEETVRESRRAVVQHCLYGVDLNEMAVELAKVSLWINSAVEDKPLSFLDHRIKQGNSLLGATPELIAEGVPADAFETSKGRSWHDGNEVRKRVRDENKGVQASLTWEFGSDAEYLSLAEQLEALEEDDISDVHEKARIFEDFEHSDALEQERLVHDVWTAAFYWPLDGSIDEYPTPETIERLRRNPPAASDEPAEELDGLDAVRAFAERTAAEQDFFHWPLEFPTVYAGESGFDCLLGNPPWEKLNFEEEQFFAVRAPEIANASTASKRSTMIDKLEETNSTLYEEYQQASEGAENLMNFMRNSGRYPLSGQGHVNTYALFSEWYANNVDPTGRVGAVVPTGIATDHTTADFFRGIVEDRRLVSLYDYNNNKNIFQGIDNRLHFCLFTLVGDAAPVEEFDVAFGMDEVEQVRDSGRRYTLSREDIRRVNPNTGTAPTFESESIAELTLNIYEMSRAFKLISGSDQNPWDAKIHRMYNMSDDSGLFRFRDEFDDEWHLDGNEYMHQSGERQLPIYESKLTHQFDHRYSTYDGVEQESVENGQARNLTTAEKNDPSTHIIPRYWLAESNYQDMSGDDWHLVFRRVTNATNRRTVIASVIPGVPTVHTINHISGLRARQAAVLMCVFNSFVVDFVARQKVGGTELSQFIIKQLPIPTPDRFQAVTLMGDPIKDRICELALQLAYTATDLDPFAEALGYDGEPFQFTGDDRSREEIRFELEALMCHVYGIEADDFELLFDSFQQIKRNDIDEHGYYRTREKIKSEFERLAGQIEVPSTTE